MELSSLVCPLLYPTGPTKAKLYQNTSSISPSFPSKKVLTTSRACSSNSVLGSEAAGTVPCSLPPPGDQQAHLPYSQLWPHQVARTLQCLHCQLQNPASIT